MTARPESRATEIALVKQALANITSKLTSIEQQLETKYAQATELALTRVAAAEMERRLQSGIDDLEKRAVTQDQFWPVKISVYGAIGLILTGAVIAVMKFGG